MKEEIKMENSCQNGSQVTDNVAAEVKSVLSRLFIPGVLWFSYLDLLLRPLSLPLMVQ